MASVLTSFFSRDSRPHFGYDLSAPTTYSYNGISMANSFKKAEPEEKVALFSANSNDLAASTLKTHAQKLKTMRHPGILTFLESIELDGKFFLVTEPCAPLTTYFADTNITNEQKEFVISWGLYQVLSTLKFLHQANISHEAVRRSIFVTPSGDWKLANMGGSSNFNSCRADLNNLAIVIWEVFNGFREDINKPEAPGKIPKRLQDLYRKLASAQVERTSAEEIVRESRATGGFFKNRFVDTLLFLEEFQLKEAHEKQAFFTNLRDHLGIFPNDVAKYKILPKLILSYEFGDAGPNILIPLFKLGHLLDEQEYQRKIVPCLVKLFSSPDRTTRVKLLERIDEFASHLTPQVVNEKIFSNLSTGFMDTSPAVREATVKAMVPLADKLNVHNLNTELMKHLARLQGTDEHGGIRTNTTICLGKIGCYLEPANRQKILIGAFTRGLKDPFPPARMAAVLALSATQQFYSLVEVANKIVPALGPVTCDPEKQVRDQGFKSIKGFLEKLEKASEHPEIIPELEAQVTAGGRGIFGSDKVPQWASWALKSLSGKFYKGTPANVATTKNENAGNTNESSSLQKKEETCLQPTAAGSDTDTENDLVEWSDAKESASNFDDFDSKKEVDNADDWGIGWEREMTSTQAPLELNKQPLKKPIKPKPRDTMGGGLKLGGASLSTLKKKETDDDNDIDVLLGIRKPQSSLTATSTPSGNWEVDDFVIDNGTTSLTKEIKVQQSREARRAEMAAKNEARAKALAERRAQKNNAISKPPPKPSTTATKSDALDGWDDF